MYWYIDIYIYILCISYIYTIQEAGEKPLSFQTAHGTPIQARKLIIESHAARWCRESFAGAPIATGSPSRFGEDKFYVFLVFFPCLFHTEFKTPSKGSLNPMSTHHFSSSRSVESTHYMYDSTMNQMTMLVFDNCLRILAVLCCFNHGAWCLNPQAGSFFLGEQPFYPSKYLLKCQLHSIA